MSLFFHRKRPLSLEGFSDAHSHILPGVDDGVRTEEDSLSILARYEQLGVREVWLTPHIMEDVPNRSQDLRERFERLCEHYRERGGKLPLYLAAEYMLDHHFKTLFQASDLLFHGEGQLLVETSYFEPPMEFEQTLFQLSAAGITPILAHPERYAYMTERDYDKLKTRGILFQMNLGSLAGIYGETVRKKAERLSKLGMYDFCGSDIHRPAMLDVFLRARIDPRWDLPLNGGPSHK